MPAFPEFIIVELTLDEFIIARLETAEPPLYRKLLAAVGRPSADLALTALSTTATMADARNEILAERRVRDSLVQINDRGEGVIAGARGAEEEDRT